MLDSFKNSGTKIKRKSKFLNITVKLSKSNIIFTAVVLALITVSLILFINYAVRLNGGIEKKLDYSDSANYVKWIDFNAPFSVLEKALKYDIDSYGKETPLNWLEILSYVTAKNWGSLTDEKKINKDIDTLVKVLQSGESLDELKASLKQYDYFFEAYNAVLGGYVGEYEVLETVKDSPEKENKETKEKWVKKYGLKVFSPVAKNYGYSHYDDFGNSRSYGYKRKHLGNDIMGSIGTPIIAVEDGYIEALGWNQYGGWRVGIRTHDKKRYYYYAHLRKDHPFNMKLKEGDFVQAGDVIGYLGMTGYSAKENVNNIDIPHLHFGIQIIFDEVQKDGINQIWVDAYNIVRLLAKNKMPVMKVEKDFEPARKIHTIPTD